MLTCKAKARLLAHFRHPRAQNHAAILLKDYKKNSQERKLRVGNIHLDELVQEIGGERDQLKPFNQPAKPVMDGRVCLRGECDGNRSIIQSSSFAGAALERRRGPRPKRSGAEPFSHANTGLRGSKAAGCRAPAVERSNDVHAPSPAHWVARSALCPGADRRAEQSITAEKSGKNSKMDGRCQQASVDNAAELVPLPAWLVLPHARLNLW